eukprot:TRINITY_DN16230_c0_g1_i1.p1 TRINITY_DN16230_c0_g1~~TRINITY_DN16230_c0_g1_i1.p1  ORF type:complete len:561 (+),score=129.58 TRINITY_DN16230_c0_g1_i1:253-1683(+)
MYIEALRMEGKTPVVTAETIAAETNRSQEEQVRKDEVSYKKKSGMTLAEQWEKEHEAEEAAAEKEMRQRAKEEAAQRSAEVKEQQNEVKEPETVTPQPTPQQVAVDNKLFEGLGHRDVRNHVLMLAETPKQNLITDVKDLGHAVTVTSSLEEAITTYKSHSQQSLPQGIIVNIIIFSEDKPPYQSTNSMAEFIDSVQRPTAAGKPPAVIVLRQRDEDEKPSEELINTFKAIHNPPYVLCTFDWSQAVKFLSANSSDVSLEDEMKVVENLVPSGNRSCGAKVPSQTIVKDVDHNLTVSTARPVRWLEVGMHWKGEFDLDLSCVLLNAKGGKQGMVYFANLDFGGKVFSHSGDMMTAPKGEKECISVNLCDVPDTVSSMYFVITSYSGEPFSEVQAIDASITVADDNNNREVMTQFPLTGTGTHRAIVLCRVYRSTSGVWGVTKVDIPHSTAETARGLVSTCQKHFREHPLPAWESTF